MANSLLTKWLAAMTTDTNGDDAIQMTGLSGTDQVTSAGSWESAYRKAIDSNNKLQNISKVGA